MATARREHEETLCKIRTEKDAAISELCGAIGQINAQHVSAKAQDPMGVVVGGRGLAKDADGLLELPMHYVGV